MTPRPTYSDKSDDPGVPGALGRALVSLVSDVGVAAMDELWVFPPLRNGRRERGVLAAGCTVSSDDPDRRLLVTLAYVAEETGRGIEFDARFSAEGEAPLDRFPRIMDGVVRRTGEAHGTPRRIQVGGVPGVLEALARELGVELTPPHETPHDSPSSPSREEPST